MLHVDDKFLEAWAPPAATGSEPMDEAPEEWASKLEALEAQLDARELKVAMLKAKLATLKAEKATEKATKKPTDTMTDTATEKAADPIAVLARSPQPPPPSSTKRSPPRRHTPCEPTPRPPPPIMSKDSLLCPITQELMADPVVSSDGHIYDRDSILRAWSAARERHEAPPADAEGCCGAAASRGGFERLSPITNARVTGVLVPAHLVVSLIEEMIEHGHPELSDDEVADWRERRAAAIEARRNSAPAEAADGDAHDAATPPGAGEGLQRRVVNREHDGDATPRDAHSRSRHRRLPLRSLSFSARSDRARAARRTLSFATSRQAAAANTAEEAAPPAEEAEEEEEEGRSPTAAERRLADRIAALEERCGALRAAAMAAPPEGQMAAMLELSNVELRLQRAQMEFARGGGGGSLRSLAHGVAVSGKAAMATAGWVVGAPARAVHRTAAAATAAVERRQEAKAKTAASADVCNILRREMRSGATKPCPQCKLPINKNGGCHHHTCPSCNVKFCWQCGGFNQSNPQRHTCGTTCGKCKRTWWSEKAILAHYKRTLA